jgi:hypothetical protein
LQFASGSDEELNAYLLLEAAHLLGNRWLRDE